jgi:hypothetical protein
MGWGDQGRKHQTRVSQAELITSPTCCMPEEGHSRRFKREVAMTAAPKERTCPPVIDSFEKCQTRKYHPTIPHASRDITWHTIRRRPSFACSVENYDASET